MAHGASVCIIRTFGEAAATPWPWPLRPLWTHAACQGWCVHGNTCRYAHVCPGCLFWGIFRKIQKRQSFNSRCFPGSVRQQCCGSEIQKWGPCGVPFFFLGGKELRQPFALKANFCPKKDLCKTVYKAAFLYKFQSSARETSASRSSRLRCRFGEHCWHQHVGRLSSNQTTISVDWHWSCQTRMLGLSSGDPEPSGKLFGLVNAASILSGRPPHIHILAGTKVSSRTLVGSPLRVLSRWSGERPWGRQPDTERERERNA